MLFMKICICNTLRTHLKDSFNNPLEMPVEKSVFILLKRTHRLYTRLKTRWIQGKTSINGLYTFITENIVEKL